MRFKILCGIWPSSGAQYAKEKLPKITIRVAAITKFIFALKLIQDFQSDPDLLVVLLLVDKLA
jgi:hypothetical protein